MDASTLVTNEDRLAFVTSAMESWCKSLGQLTVPSDLATESQIEEVLDLSAQLVQCTLLFGERTGKKDDLPYDGGGVSNRINDLSVESLWLYGKNTRAEIPTDFDTSKGLFDSKWKTFYIGTGTTRKCPSCRGKGQIVCSKCKGRGSYESGFIGSDKKTWEPCSCGNGYNECSRCWGYGAIEDAIKCDTNYRTSTPSGLIYAEDFENKSSEQTIKMVSSSMGNTMLNTVSEFPIEDMIDMLKGGVIASQYARIQDEIKGKVKRSIDEKLNVQKCDTQKLFDSFTKLFGDLPNPVQTNKVLENEILPVRLRVNIQNRPIFKVKYAYKKQPYSLWVFGNEGKIYASEKPKEFTKEAKVAVVIVGILLVVGIVAAIIMAVNSM